MKGRVAVSPVENKAAITYLLPGEQAIYKGSEVSLNKNVDTASVVAWKNGQFIFRDADIKNIMRQVERWYNAKVIFEDDITGHFNATVQRNVPVSKLLHYLELTKYVYFTINNNTITVKNQP
jgi:ferric-dicitrate binding protein FerR (iron transport regulator)